jgi:hypothetical protein
MAYSRTTWENSTPAASPVKYVITGDSEGEISASATITPATSITPGTPVNAANLNNIEDGILTLESDLADVVADVALGVPDILTAKGDLAVATAADAASPLAVGAVGTYLIPDSAEATGLKWVPVFTAGFWENASWDGDAKNANTTYNFLMSNIFSGVPNTAKMVLVYLSATWSAYNEGAVIYLSLLADPTAEPTNRLLMVRGLTNDIPNDACGWIPLTSAGRFYLRTGSFAPSAVTVTINGYML